MRNSSTRRSFLHKAGLFSATGLLTALTQPAWSRGLDHALQQAAGMPPDALAGDEDFWYYIQQCYTASPSLINLNNGGVAPSPKPVQEAMKRFHDLSNEAPSYYMWRILDQGREPLRRELAALAGCEAEEIAIHRNASEALETVIFGLPLKAGDEVVLCKQDYPNMMNAWIQRELREGIKLIWVNLDLPSEDNDYLVSSYTKVFTAKTKVVHLTHVINWNGQIMPVRKIADAAHLRGIEVVVDGAHSFAHFPYTLPALGADYFGTSLHKWLSACIGSGLLYVKKDKIKNLYPLFAAADPKSGDIRKFEATGTRPFFIEQAIGKAIEFYDMIGAERKAQRLFYLKNYWMSRVKDIPKVQLGTSMKPGFGCAIGLVNVEGKKPAELEAFLLTNYKVHTTTIDYENLKGVRVTPNVYTTTKNLDVLIRGIEQFAKGGF
ncbi:aminotransferase class V-fold PLP-dependent enzyme [Pseudoflavitalea sp. X16]|uniref:aminotransferase class V-fold PLP-dependent enzyme n=1 Tax=Paraflavitalea devenefica TaxID=2716334 RepID=UPI001421AEC7|nr:aminotransferase class V-fold PLP-dependent enzyme [Paraflavitalea devenefica]NII27505.1 aminotransferase class V-fold PLP-dependent enzyme [Paraflavitalea devenefica]